MCLYMVPSMLIQSKKILGFFFFFLHRGFTRCAKMGRGGVEGPHHGSKLSKKEIEEERGGSVEQDELRKEASFRPGETTLQGAGVGLSISADSPDDRAGDHCS